MESILQDIEKALAAGCYYVAVHMVLALPDICAALESPNGETSGRQYRSWYDGHLAPLYPMITATDCYSLRCGVLHQGRMGHPKMQYARIVFTIPTQGNIILHKNIIDDALNIDVVAFCGDFIAAVRAWANSKHNDMNVQNNTLKLVQYRPNGLAPYIIGVPVIT